MANLTTALGLYFFTCGLASVAGPIIVGAENIISPFSYLIWFDYWECFTYLPGFTHISSPHTRCCCARLDIRRVAQLRGGLLHHGRLRGGLRSLPRRAAAAGRLPRPRPRPRRGGGGGAGGGEEQ